MAQTIDQLLERSGLAINEVAERAQLQIGRVEAILTGRWLASPSEREKLAGVFEVSVEEIEWGHFMNPRNVRYHRFGMKEDFQAKSAGKPDESSGPVEP